MAYAEFHKLKFHKLTRFPIYRGAPIAYKITTLGMLSVRKAKANDKHTCFAAEDLISRSVVLCGVDSPLDIRLVYNAETIEKERKSRREALSKGLNNGI